jgi:plasmid stabilization system protein ParE
MLYTHLSVESSQAAWRWFDGLQQSILTLETDPIRCSTIPEDGRLRHLLYGRSPHVYRVIFRINEKKRSVEVVSVRHGRRDALHRYLPTTPNLIS